MEMGWVNPMGWVGLDCVLCTKKSKAWLGWAGWGGL